MKIVLAIQIFLVSLILQTSSCIEDHDSRVKWKGMNDRNDIVFLYKRDASYEQRQFFEATVIYRSRPDNKGQDMRDGVVDVMLGRTVGDYDGGVINFHANASAEQRERLRKDIESSPIVLKVVVDAIPNEIKVP